MRFLYQEPHWGIFWELRHVQACLKGQEVRPPRIYLHEGSEMTHTVGKDIHWDREESPHPQSKNKSTIALIRR